MESQLAIHYFGLWILAPLASLVLIAFVGFSLLLIGAALFEKHPIQSSKAIAADEVPVLSAYATEMNAQVRYARFTCLGARGPTRQRRQAACTTSGRAWVRPV
jgi:hypothetical protein